MRRLLAMVLVICMMVPFAVFAETTEVSTANISGTTYNIYIEGEASANNVSVMLRNEDATDVAYVAQLTPDKNNYGKYVTKFKFNGDIKNYGVYVRDDATGEDVSASVTTAIAENELYTATLNVASVNDAGNAYISEGDAIDISVDIKNKYGDNATMKVLVAAYGENNRLLDTKSTTVSALYEDLSATKDATTSFSVPAGTVKAKVFIWSDTETLIPVAPSKMLVNEDNAVTFHLVGDSLCTEYGSANYPRQGWGVFIEDYVADGVNVNNTGVASRSTFSYLYGEPGTYNLSGDFKLDSLVKGTPYNNYDTSRWNMAFINKAKQGDFVIIALGINDLYQSGYDIYECDGEKYLRKTENSKYVYAKITYNDDGSVAGVSDEWVELSGANRIYSWIALSSTEANINMIDEWNAAGYEHYMTFFKDNLRKMIDTALEAGVTPILSSTTGHYGETNYNNDAFSNASGLTTLFNEMKEVAEEYKDKGVVYLPLFEYTDELYQKWGNMARFEAVHLCDGAYEWFERYGDQDVKISYVDGVHYNVNGAKWVASLIAKMINESDSPAKAYLNETDIFDLPTI